MNVPASNPAVQPKADPIAVGTAFRQAADFFGDARLILERGSRVSTYRPGGLPTDAVSLTREGGALLAQAASGFAALYPTEQLRIDAFTGAAQVAQSVTSTSGLQSRLQRWATYAQGASDLILLSQPGFGEFPSSPTRPTQVIDQTSPPDVDRL